MHAAPVTVSSTSSPPTADMQLTPRAAKVEGRRHRATVRQPGAIQVPEDDQLGEQGHV